MDWNQDGYTLCTEIRRSLVKSHVSIRDSMQSIMNLRGMRLDITYDRWFGVIRREAERKRDRKEKGLFSGMLTSSLSVWSACCVSPDTLRTSAVFKKLLRER